MIPLTARPHGSENNKVQYVQETVMYRSFTQAVKTLGHGTTSPILASDKQNLE